MLCTPRGGLYFTEGVTVVQGDIEVRGPLSPVDVPLPGYGAFENRTVVLRAEGTQAASVWAWAACYNETRDDFMETSYDVVHLQITDGQASIDNPVPTPITRPMPQGWSQDRLLLVTEDTPESRILLEMYNPLARPVEVEVATRIQVDGDQVTWEIENMTLPPRQSVQVPIQVPSDASTVEIQSSWDAHPREFLHGGPGAVLLAKTAEGWERVAIDPGEGPGSA